MSETIYVKKGRRYKPIYEYDSLVCDSFPEGSHLVVSTPGCRITRYRVEPDAAPILAAIAMGRDAMIEAIQKASEVSSRDALLSPRELKAFEEWKKATGQETLMLNRPSAVDIFTAFEKALLQAVKEAA
jgi:hypothetical protein